ncbi:unnamed protein product [Closterium sp. NIES-64]|nr:unnamed protein product [Closterium sp. NIES-64]
MERALGLVAYRLRLPAHFRMHPSFHVSLLRPYTDPNATFSGRDRTPLPVAVDTDEPDYQIQRILKHCRRLQGVSFIDFLVHWRGYDAADDSWVPSSSPSPDNACLQAYLQSAGAADVASLGGGSVTGLDFAIAMHPAMAPSLALVASPPLSSSSAHTLPPRASASPSARCCCAATQLAPPPHPLSRAPCLPGAWRPAALPAVAPLALARPRQPRTVRAAADGDMGGMAAVVGGAVAVVGAAAVLVGLQRGGESERAGEGEGTAAKVKGGGGGEGRSVRPCMCVDSKHLMTFLLHHTHGPSRCRARRAGAAASAARARARVLCPKLPALGGPPADWAPTPPPPNAPPPGATGGGEGEMVGRKERGKGMYGRDEEAGEGAGGRERRLAVVVDGDGWGCSPPCSRVLPACEQRWVCSCASRDECAHVRAEMGVLMCAQRWVCSCARRDGCAHVRAEMGVLMCAQRWVCSCARRDGCAHVRAEMGVLMCAQRWAGEQVEVLCGVQRGSRVRHVRGAPHRGRMRALHCSEGVGGWHAATVQHA